MVAPAWEGRAERPAMGQMSYASAELPLYSSAGPEVHSRTRVMHAATGQLDS